jgi:pimeloyl-ACP methyl ester carboxylesterase
MKARVDDLVTQTEASPITVFHDNKITVLSGFEILRAFGNPIYSPQNSFPGLARILDGALQGNFTLLIKLLDEPLPRLSDACLSPNSSVVLPLYLEATFGIACSDTPASNRRVLELAGYIDTLKEQSPTMGAYWAQIMARCSGWTITPKWRFAGPIGTPPHDPALVDGKPAAPLLFLSTRLDPVTPVANAFAMSARHPGSTVAVVEGAGHCSTSVPSDCMRKIVQEYFASGAVPENGTSCKADCDPWHPCEADGWAMTTSSEERLGGKRPFYGPI